MSALYGIPQVDRVIAKPEHIVPPVEASTEQKAVPGQTEKADKSSSNTIVGALSPVLFPEIANETAATSELHKLVVDAERKKRTRGERGVLWLLLGVVVIAGGAGWLMRDFWNADPAPSIATSRPPAVAKEGSDAPATTADSQLTKPAAENAAAQKEAEAERVAEQRNTGLRREAEKITRLKQESDRLERERHAAEKKLAKQRAARIELEREAGLERRKMTEAREAAKKLAEQRTRAEARLSEAAAAKSSAAQELARRSEARASFLATEPSAYDEEDGDDIVLDTKASLRSDAAESVKK